MGYESKIYVVEKSNRLVREERRFAKVIAVFDLCVFCPFADKFTILPATDCYFYADDGDTKVIKDRYDKHLTESTVDYAINVLEELIANGETYRRAFPVLAALKAIKKQQKKGEWNEIAVLHYGH